MAGDWQGVPRRVCAPQRGTLRGSPIGFPFLSVTLLMSLSHILAGSTDDPEASIFSTICPRSWRLFCHPWAKVATHVNGAGYALQWFEPWMCTHSHGQRQEWPAMTLYSVMVRSPGDPVGETSLWVLRIVRVRP